MEPAACVAWHALLTSETLSHLHFPCCQYSIYIFAGLTGVVGALLTRRACCHGSSFRLPALVLVVSIAAVLASLGLGFYQVGVGVLGKL